MPRYTDCPTPDTQTRRSRNACAWCGGLLILAQCRGALGVACTHNGYGHPAYPCGEGSDQCCRHRALEVEQLWAQRQAEQAGVVA